MTDALEAPADTRVMGIVHRALRRDLARAREVLAVEDALTPAQRTAVGDHLLWLMAFLHEPRTRTQDRSSTRWIATTTRSLPG